MLACSVRRGELEVESFCIEALEEDDVYAAHAGDALKTLLDEAYPRGIPS